MDDPSATMVGAWTAVKVFGATTTTPTYFGATGSDTNSFGTNYLVKGQGTGAAYVQFTPRVLVDGQYDVYQWHAYRADASATVPFAITYNGGSTTVSANQQTNDGNWSLLGRFLFAAGTNGSVRVMDNFVEPAAMAMADGVKLMFVPPTNPPAAPGSLSATAMSSSQINLAWADNATNEINYLVGRGTSNGGPYTNIAILPANATNYSSSNLLSNTTYYYVVSATNTAGASPNSNQASATTGAGSPTGPSITNPPQSLTVTAGQDATFSVTAGGSAPLIYQWRFSNTNISGANGSSYTRVAAQTNDAGTYVVAITNNVSSVTSAPAMLTVNYSLATATTGGGAVSASPNLANYTPGSSVTLTAMASAGFAFSGWSGDATGTNNPLNVVMTTNMSIIAGFLSTATDIIIDNPDPFASFSGSWQTGTSSVDKYGADYRFASTVAGGLSNATYRPAIGVPGNYDVYIWYPQGGNRATNAPWSVSYLGGNTNVAVNQTVNGGGWFLIALARPLARGTNGFVRLSNDTGSSGKVVLADAVRFAFSASQPTSPGILTQPTNQTAHIGGNVTFVVAANGDAPLAYQWIYNGTNVPGATTNMFSRSNVQTNQGGVYSVVVTNWVGSVTSSNAVLTVTPPQPPQFLSINLLPDDRVRMILSGDTGSTYVLQGSGDLTSWLDLTNTVNTNGTFQFTDGPVTNHGWRFYRARLGP
jgi:uncharacterized repeat protein (TIGR02543 family)